MRRGQSRHGDMVPAGYRAANSDGLLPRTEWPWSTPSSAGNTHAPSRSESHFAVLKPAASPVLPALLPSAARLRFPAISPAIGGSTLTPWNASHPRSSCSRISETRTDASPDLPSQIQPTLCPVPLWPAAAAPSETLQLRQEVSETPVPASSGKGAMEYSLSGKVIPLRGGTEETSTVSAGLSGLWLDSLTLKE